MNAAPTKAEVSAAVEDVERAVFDFASAFADGSLGSVAPADAVELARRASASVKVAANAFGVDAQDGDTPDALMDRMLGVYAAERASEMLSMWDEEDSAKSASMRDRRRSVIEASLGLTDSDVARMDFDRDNGDWSPWLLAQERFVFG